MQDKISAFLEEYGLDKKEIKVYATLVEKGELNAYALAKITGIYRSTVYAVIERLISRGFISKIHKGEKTFYSTVEISKLIAQLKDKESLLLSLIPEFERIREEGVSRVRVFEGKRSHKQFNFNLYRQIKEGLVKELYIISGGPTGTILSEKKSSDSITSQIFLERLLKNMKNQNSKKKIKYRGIWNEKFKGSDFLRLFAGFGKNRFLKNLPTLATTIIFGEYIAYLFTINGVSQVIEIQNKLIAEENKAYFSYLWDVAKK